MLLMIRLYEFVSTCKIFSFDPFCGNVSVLISEPPDKVNDWTMFLDTLVDTRVEDCFDFVVFVAFVIEENWRWWILVTMWQSAGEVRFKLRNMENQMKGFVVFQ